MKNHASKIIASLILGAASLSRPVLAQTPAAAPVASAALEIQISTAHISKNGKNYLGIHSQHWYLDVIFRNTSDNPIELIAEDNSLGYDNFHLEITAVDGKTLITPLQVLRPGVRSWFGNALTTQMLAPNQSIVREIHFHVPAAIEHPEIPPTKEETDYDNNPIGARQDGKYWFFPFQTDFENHNVTMKAVYEVPTLKIPGDIWTGHTESPLLTYELHDSIWGRAF